MRVLLVLLLAVLAFTSVQAMEAEAPVPEGFSLPNIFNPVTDRADGREQAKVLVNLVAKEPKVAMGVGFEKEKPVEDTWNGEADAEGGATVAQKKMMQEVEALEKLIAQGQKILKALPRKQKRLALLKRSLATILDAKAKREAAEKLDQQQALLDAIKKREGAMSSRLNALKKSQQKLESSVGKLKAVISSPDPKKAAPKPRFAQVDLDAEAEAEIGAEMQADSEMEHDALHEEMDMAAAEAYAEEMQQ